LSPHRLRQALRSHLCLFSLNTLIPQLMEAHTMNQLNCDPDSLQLPSRVVQEALTQLTDAELLVLSQQHEYRPAGWELVRRYLAWVYGLIGHWARRTRLAKRHWDDAQQQAVFALLEAIDCYDCSQRARPESCSFPTFVRRVVRARCSDFCRRERWLERHQPRSGNATHLVGCVADQRADPTLDAEEHDLRAHLQQALATLSARDRLLWKRLAAGVPLRGIAAELGLSYHAVRRLRQRLVARLRVRLQGTNPGSAFPS
jgi:RNA polymerase sigma factor (sigma-70 family)